MIESTSIILISRISMTSTKVRN